MAGLTSKAVRHLAILRAIRQEQKSLGGAPGGGVDRGTRLALGEMAGDIKAVRKALSPTAAEKRSVL